MTGSGDFDREKPFVGIGTAATALDGPHGDPLFAMPLPPQAPVTEGYAEIAGTKLWYWDTGGSGQPVVLMHPATGSGLIWGYQQPTLAAAGYRVIGYSRRGYWQSNPVDPNNGGIGSEDLYHLTNHLGLERFHVIASAAGCTFTLDFALSYPERMRSMVLAAGGFGTIRDAEYVTARNSLKFEGYKRMAAEFRELGPSYRVANPAGTRAWIDLEHQAINGNRHGPGNKHEFTTATLNSIKVPTLLMSGDADLNAPPALSRILLRKIPNSELVVIAEAGHSIYWERPKAFNDAAIAFISRF